jgi:hypothetical protein
MNDTTYARLSPFNLRGLVERGMGPLNSPPAAPKARPYIKEVVMYRCPECRELHEDEDDAVECCEEPGAVAASSPDCPVCGTGASSYRDATDCCLWKDLSAADRYRIADAVEDGSTWAEQLGVGAAS